MSPTRRSHNLKHTLPRLAWWVALCNLVVLASVISASGAAAPPVRRVLILHSFGRDFAPYSAASSGFRTELARQSAAPIEFLEASLETARFAEGGSESPFVEYLRALFAERPPHLLVPFGAPAMHFLQRHRDNLFPAVPVLVGTVDKRRLTGVNLGANATAVGTSLDLPGIIENILRLLPGTTNIEVVVGNSPLERFWLAELRQDFQPFTNRVRFTWLNELSFEEMRKRVATLPRRSAILYAVLLVDAAGVPHEQERALDILRRDSNAPIFGAFDNQLGHGIVGGPLYPIEEVGRQSARLAVRILSGESAGSIETVLLGPGKSIYDWRELKRWKINESRLPPGSIVQFREPTLWEQYRWYILGALVIIAIQAAMIAALLLYRARRRRAEDKLKQNQEFLELSTNAGELGLWVRDLKAGDFSANSQLHSLFGFGPEDVLRFEDFLGRIHPDDRAQTVSAVERAQQAGEPVDLEFRAILPDGKERWLAAKGRTIQDREGHALRRMGAVIDITARKQAEEALRESEARFRTMADTAPVMIWMSDTGMLCTFFNKGWLDFTGRTLEQELGNGWADGVHREDLDRCLEVYVNSFNARQEFRMEYRLLRFDGEYCWVLDNGVPRLDSNGTFLGYIGSCIDINQRKQTDDMLRGERAFLRQVIDIDPNFIFAKDREGRFTLVNQAVADAYGTTVEGVIGKTDAEFNPNREEVEFFRRMDQDVMDTKQERFIPEERITDAQGKVRWLQTVKRPIVAMDGSANQVLGASTDITKRKEAESELQQQREELAHVTRISTMGELAASLAHELNQPLTAILSNAQAAQRFLAVKPADLEEIKDILRDIVEDNNRAGEVIRRMRALVKKDDLAFVALDLAGLIRDVVQLVHSDADLRNIRMSFESASQLPLVRGDKVQLQQVMLNLLLNAFDAMKDTPVNEREVVTRVETKGAGSVEVSVRDHGTGLTSDKLDKIFQPFYTTKREGLGMGLSISRSIIGTHGGRLWAENNADRGATFYFTVPVEKSVEGT
ncbi:MAG: hypothetical protein HW419_3542 [Deltaproteobacteria bacterium]|nr:hypothetical protein [Deltaproteobacteria bacterium]